jgi:phage tail sheath protein FI
VVAPNSAPASIDLATADAQQDLHLEALGAGSWGNQVFVRLRSGALRGFRMSLIYYRVAPPAPVVDPLDPAFATDPNRVEPDLVEDYDNLGFDPDGPNYVLTTINGRSNLVRAEWTDPARDPADPTVPIDFAAGALQNGADDPNPAGDGDYIGVAAAPIPQRTGLAALESIDQISILCVPDEINPGVPNRGNITVELVSQCQRLRDRFAILHVDEGQGDVGALAQAAGNFPTTSYAAVYYPWIRVFNPTGQGTLLVPPGGHVTGIYARTDIERGVHKAPANADVRGITLRDYGDDAPVEFKISKGQHDLLNPVGINVIRDFRPDNRGIRVWGARTRSDDPQWKYVNVRRLFIFVEESIDEGTQWVVFEPNDEATWAAVVRSVTTFLVRVWRSGALMGLTQEEAFFVKCDRTTMTQDDIDNGRLVCLIGIAPVKPAEFVIFRISQKTVEATA